MAESIPWQSPFHGKHSTQGLRFQLKTQQVSQYSTKFGNRSFYVVGSTVWNNLLYQVMNALHQEMLESQFKTRALIKQLHNCHLLLNSSHSNLSFSLNCAMALYKSSYYLL